MSSSLFSTTRLPLAAFLHCNNLLYFVGCEATDNGQVKFIFSDPDSNGDQVELRFDKGDATVNVLAFTSSDRFLRRKMRSCVKEQQDKKQLELAFGQQPKLTAEELVQKWD